MVKLPVIQPTADHDHAPDRAAIALPGLLVLRLMSRCNNRCVFCMVEEEIDTSEDVPYEQAAAAIERQPTGTKIEFFGGEPTIHPRFLDLLALARDRGHPCSIATHGRTFVSRRFTDRVARLGVDEIYVRTSLYGDDAALHDSYTQVDRSFEQTVGGICNVVAAGFRCQVNVVIMARNHTRLVEMTRAVKSWGVPRIKFSNLVDLDHCPAEAVSLAEVKPHLIEAIELAEHLGLTVTVEKTPICATGGRIDLMSTERLIGQWDRSFLDDGPCGGCLVRRWCEGVDPAYPARFGAAGLGRVETIPGHAVPDGLDHGRTPEFLRLHCVRVPDGPLDDAAMEHVAGLAAEVERRLGMLAVFPARFLGV
jgi:molybdenum cofactor biosynthesis enzyme MoaA